MRQDVVIDQAKTAAVAGEFVSEFRQAREYARRDPWRAVNEVRRSAFRPKRIRPTFRAVRQGEPESRHIAQDVASASCR